MDILDLLLSFIKYVAYLAWRIPLHANDCLIEAFAYRCLACRTISILWT